MDVATVARCAGHKILASTMRHDYRDESSKKQVLARWDLPDDIHSPARVVLSSSVSG
jgi:hypothetical protein